MKRKLKKETKVLSSAVEIILSRQKERAEAEKRIAQRPKPQPPKQPEQKTQILDFDIDYLFE